MEEFSVEKANQKENSHEEDYKKCGWLCFQPNFIQKFRTAKWILFWLCWAGAAQGMLVNGFVNVVITTIEKRFGLKSFQSGLIAGGYDIASFLSLIPVTYLGGRNKASKPRWIGFGVLVMGLGALVFSIPHFINGPYKVSTVQPNICRRIVNITDYDEGCNSDSSQERDNVAMWIFFLGQLLHGAGAAPLYTLGVTFIDENISKKMSSVYIGIYYTMAIVGPALGYVVGGQMLHIYTDFLTVDPADLGLTSSNSVWIGAWWIGFVIAAIMCVAIAIPILAFPPLVPGAKELQKQKESEAHGEDDTTTSVAFTRIREIPQALKALLVNPTFFFLNMAGASEGLLVAGFAAFLPKVIENQFSLTATWAALIMGSVTVPAGGGGTYLGGYFVKKFKLKCSGIIKLCVYASIAALCFTGGFVLSCPNLKYAGINEPYLNSSHHLSLDQQCNLRCSCAATKFEPICGANNIMYFSPCYAGCKEEYYVDGSKAYKGCNCINNDYGEEYDAVNTVCSNDCNKMWIFIILTFGTMFFTFLSTMPALTATLRCVRDDQRSFGLGIQWIKVRLLGTIPAPIIFGFAIDKTCTLWQETCENEGACLLYDNKAMSGYMLAIALIGKALSVVFFFLAYWCYKPPQRLQNNGT